MKSSSSLAKFIAKEIEKAGLLNAIQYTTTTPCPARTSGIYIQQNYEAAKKDLAILIDLNLSRILKGVEYISQESARNWGGDEISRLYHISNRVQHLIKSLKIEEK